MSNDMRGLAIGSHRLFCDETTDPVKRSALACPDWSTGAVEPPPRF